MFDELGAKIWINEWHGAEVQTKDHGVICGELLKGGQGTPKY